MILLREAEGIDSTVLANNQNLTILQKMGSLFKKSFSEAKNVKQILHDKPQTTEGLLNLERISTPKGEFGIKPHILSHGKSYTLLSVCTLFSHNIN